jgi:hypothetical protein
MGGTVECMGKAMMSIKLKSVNLGDINLNAQGKIMSKLRITGFLDLVHHPVF